MSKSAYSKVYTKAYNKESSKILPGGAPTVCTPLTLVAQNLAGTQLNSINTSTKVVTSTNDSPISVGNQAVFVSSDPITNNSDVIHVGMVYNDEAQINAQNTIGLLPSIAQPFTGFGDAIALPQISPNASTPGTGVVFDAIAVSPIATNQTITSEASAGAGNGWYCYIDIDMANETVAYKDKNGNPSALSVGQAPGWNSSPFFMGWFDGAGDLLNDSIAFIYLDGTLPDRDPTLGAVAPCTLI